MKDNALLKRPLTEAEIVQLEDFLMSDSVPEEAMDISMMDGFITALASASSLTMPSAMLRWIWDSEHGQDAPMFASNAEAESIITLILRHWNDINDTLSHAPDEYQPLTLERAADGRTIPILDSWCSGYYRHHLVGAIHVSAAGAGVALDPSPRYESAQASLITEEEPA
jgi:uncharacterized protein